ncbi:MAG: hypothetical protein RhofKO_06230 [Rhodothermales bacterium]
MPIAQEPDEQALDHVSLPHYGAANFVQQVIDKGTGLADAVANGGKVERRGAHESGAEEKDKRRAKIRAEHTRCDCPDRINGQSGALVSK